MLEDLHYSEVAFFKPPCTEEKLVQDRDVWYHSKVPLKKSKRQNGYKSKWYLNSNF